MQTVNYIQHLRQFIERSGGDKRLRANDISLYFMLFHCWNSHHFQTMFPVNRGELMRLSHIGCRESYMKSIRRLHDCGYIIYRKAERQFEESNIMMIPLSAEPENRPHIQPGNMPHTEPGNRPPEKRESRPHTGVEIRPHTGRFPGLLYNKTNINNIKPERANSDARPREKFKNEISKEKKIPEEEDVLAYFRESGLSLQEARKFFSHYEATGWLMSGTPICNWQAAARKWAENIDSFTPKKIDNGKLQAGRLHVNQNKRYDIPL